MTTKKRKVFALCLGALFLLGTALLLYASATHRSLGEIFPFRGKEEETDEDQAEEKAQEPAKPAAPAYDPTKPSGLEGDAKQNGFSDDEDDDPNPQMQEIQERRERKFKAAAAKQAPSLHEEEEDGSDERRTVAGKVVEPLPGVTVKVIDFGRGK